jgi:uncharacterized protein YndB with AHSA1/START domain
MESAMPSFDDAATSRAAPEEVWKVLYDPVCFPRWWAGIESVEAERADDGGRRYTMYPDGYPDFPMPQVLRSSRHEGRVTISCLVSDLTFEWRLEPLDERRGTLIRVHVEIPEAEAHRLEGQRQIISSSLQRLAALAGDG